jgi:hypothetical protein
MSDTQWLCAPAASCCIVLCLQLEFLSNRLLIARGVTLTLENLALGRARKTSGQSIPFFAGSCVLCVCLCL